MAKVVPIKTEYKKAKVTRKATKVIGTEEYINAKTGEIEEMQVTVIEDRDANFHKIWLGHLLESLDLIGNQKIRVALFVMNNLNSDNQFIMTYRKISEKTGISTKTITETMKILMESNFISKIANGVYMINPDVLFKGGKENRMNVLLKYTKGE